jgi:SAM-dependent methyltransferase
LTGCAATPIDAERRTEVVNRAHIEYLSSPEWAATLQAELVPWLDAAGDLGDDVLEIGPGPGQTTDILRRRSPRVTAVELDPALAAPLAARLAGTNVEVHCADATDLPFETGRFSAVTMFSVLHHVPSPEEQDLVFAEIRRVLRPGGAFVGVDPIDRPDLRIGHQDDTFVPVDPASLPERLGRFGFAETRVDLVDYQFRFVAR